MEEHRIDVRIAPNIVLTSGTYRKAWPSTAFAASSGACHPPHSTTMELMGGVGSLIFGVYGLVITRLKEEL